MSPILLRADAEQTWNGRNNQKGAVLIMALVILVVMTILGVTVMNTSSLEEKMAGNTQEHTRAFQVAESGLERVRQDMTKVNTMTTFDDPLPEGPFYYGSSKVTVDTTRKPDTVPARTADLDGMHSATDTVMNKFTQLGKATTTTTAKADIQQGISRAAPK